MAEDLARMWGNLSLIEEDVEMEIQKEAMEGIVIRGKSCLVGKLISDRYVNKMAIKSADMCQILHIWTP
jgi:hypothetical protein